MSRWTRAAVTAALLALGTLAPLGDRPAEAGVAPPRVGELPAEALPEAPLGAGSPILVRYSFDDDLTATGPDTFRVFRDAKGSVTLATAFRRSGVHAVELRDVAGDGAFPELQGYFPVRRAGWLFARFALLTTDPAQELNVALAGPAWFSLAKDGIAVWLATRDGHLFHVSDSIPKRLLPITPFTWYGVEVDYDVAAGRYDLRIFEEGKDEPVLALAGQPNAANQPGSAVDKFSFIGDNGDDRSSVTYYVDDVLLAIERPVTLPPFAAPGRRRFFVDLFGDRRDPRTGPIACPPVLALPELVGDATVAARAPRQDEALAVWQEGCAALAGGHGDAALARFAAAARLAPTARLPALGRLLALITLGRLDEAEALLAELHSAWQDDPRFAVAAALVGARRGRLDEARRWLEGPAGRVGAGSAAQLLAAEQLFAVLMVEGNHTAARTYALRVASALTARDDARAAAGWLERAGDAAFQNRDAEEARRLYTQALPGAGDLGPLFLKLADTLYLLGDLAGEKRLRETIYGSLD